MAEKPTTIFFSWQSDTPSSRNRQFIEESLREAIETIAADSKLELADRPITLDKDTAGVAGSPPIVQTIFEKIDRCTAFVADMTFVGKSLPELAYKKDRLIPNPNVLVEHGYALSRRTFSRVISVMNTSYGVCNEATLPFDLRHMRWPITYELSKDQSKEPVKKAFVEKLIVALRSILLLGDDRSRDDIVSAIQVFESAVSDGKPNTGYLSDKVFGKIEKELTQQRIRQEDDKPFDETLIESLKKLKPLRDGFLEVCDVWLRSDSYQPFVPKVVAFIQKVKALQMRPANASGWDDKFGDNFGFLAHELLLSTVAILLKLERFDVLAEFLGTKFVIPNPDTPTKPDTARFQILYDYSEVLEERNQRSSPRKISPHGSLLVSRADSTFVDKDWLRQADLLCTIVHLTQPSQYRWWPHTLLNDYRVRIRSDAFQKAESRKFYDKNLRSVLGGHDLAGFKRRMEEEFGENGRGTKYIADGASPNWEAMLNWDKLGTEL